ncbi:Uncharacterized membrane protein [Micromonospora rhizosphaerae]|uniref:Uncharacterized membrane protein n=1 Tax=Micromonospora rhizosphaerae TaxID=568872 RepID=A0A1C6TAA0_9ACTN|nr:cyclase [Micromonospora rhizosphaerae]SCL38681.1 Uncharacterized membrane protein [Micromonospora rhizosphaerae]
MASKGTKWAVAGGATVAAVGVGRLVARRRQQLERKDGWYVVHRGITVDRPVDEVIGFWTDRERLDRALAEWATLKQLDDNRFRCVARDRARGGTEWRAEITVDGPGRLSWRVIEGPIPQQGRIELVRAQQDGGTDIRAEMRWRSDPARRALELTNGRDPARALQDALRRIKSLIESG